MQMMSKHPMNPMQHDLMSPGEEIAVEPLWQPLAPTEWRDFPTEPFEQGVGGTSTWSAVVIDGGAEPGALLANLFHEDKRIRCEAALALVFWGPGLEQQLRLVAEAESSPAWFLKEFLLHSDLSEDLSGRIDDFSLPMQRRAADALARAILSRDAMPRVHMPSALYEEMRAIHKALCDGKGPEAAGAEGASLRKQIEALWLQMTDESQRTSTLKAKRRRRAGRGAIVRPLPRDPVVDEIETRSESAVALAPEFEPIPEAYQLPLTGGAREQADASELMTGTFAGEFGGEFGDAWEDESTMMSAAAPALRGYAPNDDMSDAFGDEIYDCADTSLMAPPAPQAPSGAPVAFGAVNEPVESDLIAQDMASLDIPVAAKSKGGFFGGGGTAQSHRADTGPQAPPRRKAYEKAAASASRLPKEAATAPQASLGEKQQKEQAQAAQTILVPQQAPPKKRLFESMLSNKAGRPGPVERVFARSMTLMRAMQAMVGLRMVALLHAFDGALEMVSEYVSRVYGLWLMLRARGKKWQRSARGTLHTEIAQDVYQLRAQLSQCLSLAGYAPEGQLGQHPTETLEEALGKRTFPLARVLALRGHLLAVKHDIKALPSMQLRFGLDASLEGAIETAEAAGLSWGQMLRSLVPNPFAFLASWKDLIVMALLMRYRRDDIEAMYAEMLACTQQALQLSLQEQARRSGEMEEVPLDLLAWQEHEVALLERLALDLHADDLRKAVQRAEKSMQKLLQALCFPQRLVSYRKWKTDELLQEVRKSTQVQRPSLTLAWELRLIKELKRLRRKHRHLAKPSEPWLECLEAEDRRARHKALQRLTHLG